MSVYFIQESAGGYVKIGHARNPQARFAAIQSNFPHDLRILRIIDGSQKAERWFHGRFAKQRVRGEWFVFAEEMLTLAAPDEIPDPPRQIVRYRSTGAYLRAANKLGLLSERMQREYKPLLDSNV